MSAREIRLGMIGCGRRAPAYPRTVKAVPNARLVALCDRVQPCVKRIKALAGDPDIREYTDHRAMLRDPELDAVIVCTEPEYQAALSCEVMEAGKDVYSEVPAAFTLDECWQLVVTAEKTGKVYYLGEQVRHTALMRYWRLLVQNGTLGTVLFAEGHYLHAMAADRCWRNPDTGELLTWEQARTAPRKVKTRIWNMKHPILYGPHELSPLLKVLDDRVVSVSCLETGRPSKRFREVPYPGMDVEFPFPDLQVALMHTARGAVLRFAAGFQVPLSETHWYHVMGTKGEVETRRGAAESGYIYTYPEPVLQDGPYRCPRRAEAWFHPSSPAPAEITAQLDNSLFTPEMGQTGHGGTDAFPIADFVRRLRAGTPPDIDVYQAVETAAPCIVAGHSAEQGGARLEVPDFRPGPQRKSGTMPKKGSS